MSRVRILPPEVAGKIAAGEVIERPASVVKELVENSIDAGAARITAAIEEGGKRSIRVEDDGCGMSREDSLVAFERHATSKLVHAEELLSVSTRGFRGEALPSIAEVSRMQLWTNDGESECGTYIRISGGHKERVEDAAIPRGTIVQADDLFFNFPAREKFLKAAGGEAGHVARVVELAALSCPRAYFSLKSGGRKLLQCDPASTRSQRVAQVVGDGVELLEFEETAGPFHWHGFIAPPLERAVERPFQHFFVNDRPIRDRTLSFALRRAYQEYLQREANPAAVIYLETATGIVDVNVHPTKAEVKFLDSNQVFRGLVGAVKRRLGKMQVFVDVHAEEATHGIPAGEAIGRIAYPAPFLRSDSTSAAARTGALPPGALPATAQLPRQMPLQEPSALREMRSTILGQYLDSFIVVALPDGIIVVDQHNAHERALYEDFCGRSGPPSASQPFLIPPILDLSQAAFGTLMEHAPDLARHGLVIEESGPRSLAIREAPVELGEAGAIAFLGELVRSTEAGGSLQAFVEFHLLRGMACHAAVKINTPLTIEKMDKIVRDLFATSTPMVCPHGRPIIVKLRLEEILRGLRRSRDTFDSY